MGATPLHITAPTDPEPDGAPSAVGQALRNATAGTEPAAAGPAEVAAAQGTLAARLRAQAARLQQRTFKFPVPPLDVWGQDLVVEVKPIELKDMPDQRLIYESTVRVLYRSETGALEPIDGGWEGVGAIMDLGGDGNITVGEIIRTVCGTREAVHSLAVDIVAWIMGRTSRHEQALGE